MEAYIGVSQEFTTARVVAATARGKLLRLPHHFWRKMAWMGCRDVPRPVWFLPRAVVHFCDFSSAVFSFKGSTCKGHNFIVRTPNQEILEPKVDFRKCTSTFMFYRFFESIFVFPKLPLTCYCSVENNFRELFKTSL